MFRLRKPVHVRIIDVPSSMYIEPTFIAVPLPNGKVLVLHGNFESISDDDADLLVQNRLDKMAS